MRKSRVVGLTALAAAATLVLAACGGSSSSTTTSSTAANAPAGSGEATSGGGAAAGSGSAAAGGDAGTITYAQEQEWYDYNTGTTSGNATANQVVLNQVLRGFSYVDNKGVLQHDSDFGTFEKVSDSPLTVKYTFNDKAVWSDGTPVDCADFLLAWASGS